MAKSIVINATEEVREITIVFKGGVAVEAHIFHHTVDDDTGAVVATRPEPIILDQVGIAADPLLAPFAAALPADADAKRTDKDDADAAAKAVTP